MVSHLANKQNYLTVQGLSEVELNKSASSATVRRIYTENNLFLDLSTLSKSFQTILTHYTMLVIARVAQVKKHTASKDYNPYKLAFG